MSLFGQSFLSSRSRILRSAVAGCVLMLSLSACSGQKSWLPSWRATPTPARIVKTPVRKPPVRRKAAPKTTPKASATPTATLITPTATPLPPLRIQPELAPEQSRKLEREARAALASAEGMLKEVESKAQPSERQDRIAIVRGLLQQARAAAEEGDWQRAHTMAKKAQVIGKDLARD